MVVKIITNKNWLVLKVLIDTFLLALKVTELIVASFSASPDNCAKLRFDVKLTAKVKLIFGTDRALSSRQIICNCHCRAKLDQLLRDS
ncbi:MAG: hypothetical protein OFPI_02410 [Osedax symbiont Rs2]|nr:MAG: hypothetical protein OFPI_02410 [Osedax symbiont Rs2]